jgi:hypothetical protein
MLLLSVYCIIFSLFSVCLCKILNLSRMHLLLLKLWISCDERSFKIDLLCFSPAEQCHGGRLSCSGLRWIFPIWITSTLDKRVGGGSHCGQVIVMEALVRVRAYNLAALSVHPNCERARRTSCSRQCPAEPSAESFLVSCLCRCQLIACRTREKRWHCGLQLRLRRGWKRSSGAETGRTNMVGGFDQQCSEWRNVVI